VPVACQNGAETTDIGRRMVSLSPVSPPAWWRSQVRIGRDHWVRVDTNDYSVHPQAIGRTVQVTVTAEQVTALTGTTVVARHERCRARHQTITDPGHAAAAAVMRGRVQPAVCVAATSNLPVG
jgi:hypothetical protein